MSRTKWLVFIWLLIFLPALAGCDSPAGKIEDWQIEAWTKDIEYLKKELPETHVNPFYTMDQAEFDRRLDALEANLPQMNEDEIRVELQKVIAALGDEHTGSNIPAKEVYPLDLMWLSDGWYVINTTPEYSRALYGKLQTIHGHAVDEVTTSLAEMISHSNDSWLKAQMKYYLPMRGVLRGLHYIGDGAKVDFTFTGRSGENIELNMAPVSGDVYFDKIVGKGKSAEAVPLYMKNSDSDYWYEVLPENKVVYFKYNSCVETPEKPIKDFLEELLQLAEKNEKLVIDLRDNQGGDSSLLDGFIDELAGSHLNNKKSLYVIIGRRTFSAAVLNALKLKYKTSAFFVGEPSGGKPIHFGETSYFRLPELKVTVKYSTKYFDQYMAGNTPRPIPDTGESLFPDETIEPTIEDYINNNDPVLKFILNE